MVGGISPPEIIIILIVLVVIASLAYMLLRLLRTWFGKAAIEAGLEPISDGLAPPGVGVQIKAPPIRILFLAANPVDTSPLRLGEEIRAIDQALQQARFRDRFELEQQWAVRVGDLQSHLLRYGPQIVHFSGHGSASSEIILEDANGESRPVPQPALSQLFSLVADSVRCVVLNACYSTEQADGIAKSVGCVIGMSDAISDEASVIFASSFYRALAYGKSVRTAFDLGISELNLQSISDYDVPRLLAGRDNPEDVVFA